MKLSRRVLLTLMAAGAAQPRVAWGGPRARFLATWQQGAGGYCAGILDGAGEVRASAPLPERGHGMAVDPGGRYAVVFARRPGTFALALDTLSGEVVREIAADSGRHFYGHGAFSADGRRLYATENDYDGERGVVGVYDARDGFARIGEIPSHGIGPHEIRLHPDGKTLVVANGGILTHPAAPRAKLNVATMAPALALVDAASGRLVHRAAPPPAWHKLSLRHLDVAPDGTVVVVGQWEGAALERPPLVATCRAGGPLRFLTAPAEVHARMENYCGSVAFAAGGRSFGVTAPRGGLAAVWQRDGTFLGARELADVCAIDAAEGGFFVASGTGATATLRPDGLVPLATSDRRFDNHLRRIA